jgi:lysophospholipase L1-like esterase
MLTLWTRTGRRLRLTSTLALAACSIGCTIGDSITFGYQSSTGGGYRIKLLQDIWASNRNATFVGDDSSGPDSLDGRPFPRNNEGYSGYTIDDTGPPINRTGIAPLVPAALAKWAPNIVTLMIGTNDMGTNNDVANAPARLANLIDSILATSPNALLVVAQITPTGDDGLNALIRTYNAAIPALVSSRAAAGKHIIMVDMYSAFTADAAYKTDYMNGSLHPNDTGYALMGDVWYAAIADYLPNPIAGTHVIVNKQTGLAIDNAGAPGQGAGVIQWGVNGGPPQRWTFTQNADTSWNIVSADSGLSLDDPAFSTTNGTQLEQWGSNGGANQKWWVDPIAVGGYRIWNVYSQASLDGSSATANGAPLIQWGWNGGDQQLWFLE